MKRTLSMAKGPWLTTVMFLLLASPFISPRACAQNFLHLDGNNDYVSCPYNAFPSELTFSAWINTTGTDSVTSYAGNAAMNIIGDTRQAVTIGFGVHGGRVRYNQHVLANGNQWFYVEGVRTVNDGVWHHIAVSHEASGQIVIYVDGVVDAIGNIPLNQGFGNNAMNIIGAGFGEQDHFEGLLGDVVGFRRALSQGEVQDLMANGLTGSETGLYFWYSMDQGVCAGANSAFATVVDNGPYSRDGLTYYVALSGCTSNFVCAGPNCNYSAPAPPTSVSVPTLSEWGFIILGLTILCMGAIAIWNSRMKGEEKGKAMGN